MTFGIMKPRLPLICTSSAIFLALVCTASAQTDVRRSRAPAPVERTLTTKDGIVLRITYYAGLEGPETTPVLLLHDFNESRVGFDSLARVIQDPAIVGVEESKTRAVVTVDLRGHGESKSAIVVGGGSVTLDASRFQTADFQNMVLFDLETVRQFLITENDAGRLNINKLCVLGTGMGANVAVVWTARDWDMPPLAVRKQGQDIKGLILVSPQWNFRGLSLANAFKQPDLRREVSVLLAYGEESPDAKRDAENVLDNLEPFHPDPPRDRTAELKSLYNIPLPTTLQGAELLTREQFDLTPRVDLFIARRLDAKPFAWTKRLLD